MNEFKVILQSKHNFYFNQSIKNGQIQQQIQRLRYDTEGCLNDLIT